MDELGKVLQERMVEQEWTQQRLAEEVGVTRQTLLRKLKDPSGFTLRQLHAVCTALGVGLEVHLT